MLLFEELVDRHVDLVHHVALAWARDPSEAEDLTQIAFIKAWRAFRQFRAGTSFKAWVLRILRSAWIDRCRSAAREPSADGVALDATGDPEGPPPPPPQAIDLESKEIFYDVFGDDVARLLQQMPEGLQLAVLLCDVEGLAYREIADVLGVPVGTVRSRIHRGRAMLAERLRGYARRVGYLREAKP